MTIVQFSRGVSRASKREASLRQRSSIRGIAEAIVRDVAPTVGGLPIDMHLVSTQLQVEKDEVIK
jgi:hypothetical protein